MAPNPTDETQCCPVFDTSRWDEKTHEWYDKPFLRDDVFQIMHIPMNMGSVVKRMYQQIIDADASPDPSDFLMLAYDPSPWRSEIYMSVTKEIPNARIQMLSGTFVSKVFDGPYHMVPQWITQMDEFLLQRNQKSIKYYFYYGYCPKCAKKYGHNYCVAFAQVK
ncbi:hypothetical protein HGA91_00420 [candidate division WWE3 bacterium]|nr:hypothetical protein [candidate division WWE3 bacterium]